MANLIEAAGRDTRNNTPEKQFAISHAGLILAHAGVIIPDQPSILVNPSTHPRFHPENEKLRQAEWLADRFAKPLGLSRQQYMDKVPDFPEQEAEDVNIPVVVQGPVAVKGLTRVKILDILEVGHDKAVVGKFKDWEKDPKGFQTPELYTTYIDDGSNHINQ